MPTDLYNQELLDGLYLPIVLSLFQKASHEYGPLSDHNLITIHLTGSKQITYVVAGN